MIYLKTQKNKEKKEKNPLVKKAVVFSVIILLVMVLIALALIFLFKGDDKKTETVEKKTLSTLEKYGYTLDDMDTELYKTEFNILKTNLESEKVDFEAYAKSIAKLFTIDLFTMDNKINKYDVGGKEFIYPANVDNYSLKVEDTIYNNLEDNSKGTRKQSLPVVKSVDVSIKTGTFEYKPDSDKSINKKYDAYIAKVSIEYEKKLDYPSSIELTIIKEDDKLYVANIK